MYFYFILHKVFTQTLPNKIEEKLNDNHSNLQHHKNFSK